MSLTVQGIASDTSVDIRQVLGTTGNDLSILTGWIDRIHKDCLHSSVFSYLNIGSFPFSTIVGVAQYDNTNTSINFQAIRRITSIYDRTRDRLLFPLERATAAVSQLEKQEPNPGQMPSPTTKYGPGVISALSLQSGQPEYFRHTNSGGGPGTPGSIILYPTPKQVLQLQAGYEGLVVTLVNPTDQLVVPEDGRDMVVAGVNYLGNLYLKRLDEAQVWASIYSALKKGESLV